VNQEETRTVTQVIGANMRLLRERRAKVLHDVATAARDLGLTWDASAVSRIETGRRDFTLEEFLALPLLLSLALNETITLADLLRVEEEDELLNNFGRLTTAGPVLALLAEPFFEYRSWRGKTEVGRMVREWLNEDKRRAQAKREPAEERSAYRDMEEIAHELGVNVGDVFRAYRELWGEYTGSLASERERRLVHSAADLSSPTSVRTQRGHITRQLMTELRDYFAARKQGDPPTGGE